MVWLLLKLCTSVFMSWCPWRRESGIWCYSWKNNHSLLGVLKRAAQIEQEGSWRRKKKYLWSKGFLMCLRGNSYGKGQIREKLWFIGCLADAARNFFKNKFELHIKNEKKNYPKPSDSCPSDIQYSIHPTLLAICYCLGRGGQQWRLQRWKPVDSCPQQSFHSIGTGWTIGGRWWKRKPRTTVN